MKIIVGTRSSVPSMRSVFCGQRGCGMPGFTFAQKPYSLAASSSQKLTGRSSVKVKRTIDLIDLKPYFHGVTSRIGAPFWFGSGLP